jgi:DNA-binding PadR family transcriptional regulator
MRRTSLGEFEEIVLLTIAILGDDAYGIRIMEEIKEQTGRALSISAIHATLQRLEDKGFVHSFMGGATAERGGRRKRFFTVNKAGSHILHEIRQQRQQLWQRVPDGVLRWEPA